MARLLVSGRWYEGLSSSAHYESEYEQLVIQHGEHLFPGWTLVPFKLNIESDSGVWRADFALIAKDYASWWVGEVELAHHSLEGHVIPQVRAFSSGRYTNDHAEYLSKQRLDLDVDKLREMMRGEQPEVLVVVDQPVPTWTKPLAGFGALVTIVEVFRSDRNDFCLRINGQQPQTQTPRVTSLKRHGVLPRTMVVMSPASLGGAGGQRFLIDLNGTLTEWVRVETGDQVLLRAQKWDPLIGRMKAEIVRLPDDRLAFRGDNGD